MNYTEHWSGRDKIKNHRWSVRNSLAVHTQLETAKHFGITVPAVSQIERRAFQKIRLRMHDLLEELRA